MTNRSMHRLALVTLGATLALTACGAAERLNPLRLFGTDREERIEAAAAVPTQPVVETVLSLSVDPTPGGAIVSAVGLPPTQGWWEADLVRVASADPSVAVLEFRILPPVDPRPAGTQPSREVLAGAFLSRQDLDGISTIAVQGRANRRLISRR